MRQDKEVLASFRVHHRHFGWCRASSCTIASYRAMRSSPLSSLSESLPNLSIDTSRWQYMLQGGMRRDRISRLERRLVFLSPSTVLQLACTDSWWKKPGGPISPVDYHPYHSPRRYRHRSSPRRHQKPELGLIVLRCQRWRTKCHEPSGIQAILLRYYFLVSLFRYTAEFNLYRVKQEYFFPLSSLFRDWGEIHELL